MKTNSFLISIGFGDVSEIICEKPCYEDGDLALFCSIQTHKLISRQIVAGGFGLYIGDRLHATPNYLSQVIESGWDAKQDNGILLSYTAETGILTIDSDLLGTEYIYYYTDGEKCLVSNRLENITTLKSFSPDLTGIYQYMRDVYCVGALLQ